LGSFLKTLETKQITVWIGMGAIALRLGGRIACVMAALTQLNCERKTCRNLAAVLGDSCGDHFQFWLTQSSDRLSLVLNPAE
jgi:hypothetical protein